MESVAEFFEKFEKKAAENNKANDSDEVGHTEVLATKSRLPCSF